MRRAWVVLAVLAFAPPAYAATDPPFALEYDVSGGQASAGLDVGPVGPLTTRLEMGFRPNRTDPTDSVLHARTTTTDGNGRVNVTADVPRSLCTACDGAGEVGQRAPVAMQGRVGAAADAGHPTISVPGQVVLGAGASASLALLLRALALALHSRLPTDRVLEHPRRSRILEVLAEEPGLNASQVAARAKMPRTSALHHLAILRVHDFIGAVGRGRTTVFFARGAGKGAATALASGALRRPTRKAVATAVLAASSPPTQDELAAATGMARRLVAYHLQALVVEDLVEVIDGRPRRYAPTDVLRGLAVPSGPTRGVRPDRPDPHGSST